jgi:hypothetical protein
MCSGSAQQWRRVPMDLAKTKGRVRSRRTHGFQRTRSNGEESTRRRQPSPISLAAPERDRALPGEGELESFPGVLGGDVGELGGGKEWKGRDERGAGLFI